MLPVIPYKEAEASVMLRYCDDSRSNIPVVPTCPVPEVAELLFVRLYPFVCWSVVIVELSQWTEMRLVLSAILF